MPKTRAQKEATLKQVAEALTGAKGLVFSGFQKLSVKETTELRALLRKEGVRLFVAKRTLLTKACEQLKLPVPDAALFAGGLQVAISLEDEVAPARVLHQFAKTHPALELRGGVLDGALMTKQQVTTLAQLPGKDALRGQLVSVLAAPLRGLVTVMAGPLRGFITVLSKKAEQPSNP